MDSLFKDHYERFFLAFIVKDTDFLETVRQYLEPEFFSSSITQRLATLVINFYDEFRAAPDQAVLTEAEKYRPVLKDEVTNDLKAYAQKILELPLQNRDYVMRDFDRFLRGQKLKNLIPQLVEGGKKDRYEDVDKLLKEYINFRPTGQWDPGQHYDADPRERVERRKKEIEDPLFTLIPELDEHRCYLRPGELGLLLSQRSSIGKTTFLLHLARAAVVQGKKVIYYSTEESKEEIEDRLDQAVAGLKKEELCNEELIAKSMSHFYSFGGDLQIKKVPAGTPVSWLRAHTKMLRNTKNFMPDVVVIDYLGECGHEDPRVTDLYTIGKQTFSGAKTWASEEGIRIWTADQSGRQAANKEGGADGEDVAGSISKIALCDKVISLNRTKEQEEQNLLTLFAIKNRQGPSRFARVVHTDYSKCLAYVSKNSAQET